MLVMWFDMLFFVILEGKVSVMIIVLIWYGMFGE